MLNNSNEPMSDDALQKGADELRNRTPLTDEQIRSAVVGELRPLSARIQVVDYDPQWPELFRRDAEESAPFWVRRR